MSVVSPAPSLDPRVIQPYHYVAVTSAGVRTNITNQATPAAGSHTVAEAQAVAATLLASTGAAVVEIWPAAPPCHNPNNSF
jgi:hypothetical protein